MGSAAGKSLAHLHDKESENKIIALVELGKIKDPDSVTQIFKTATDEDERVRTQTAICLGELGDIRAGDTLLRLARDVDPAVRMESANALGIIGGAGFPAAKGTLEKMIADENYRVKKYAVKGLGLCGDSKSIDILVEIFNKNETALELKEFIAQSIGHIGGGHAMEVLNTWVNNGSMEVRREAVNALGVIGSQAAVDCLVKIVNDKEEDKVIVNYAKAALKNIVNVAKDRYLELKKKIEDSL
jgi:HEAT repeat protein